MCSGLRSIRYLFSATVSAVPKCWGWAAHKEKAVNTVGLVYFNEVAQTKTDTHIRTHIAYVPRGVRMWTYGTYEPKSVGPPHVYLEVFWKCEYSRWSGAPEIWLSKQHFWQDWIFNVKYLLQKKLIESLEITFLCPPFCVMNKFAVKELISLQIIFGGELNNSKSRNLEISVGEQVYCNNSSNNFFIWACQFCRFATTRHNALRFNLSFGQGLPKPQTGPHAFQILVTTKTFPKVSGWITARMMHTSSPAPESSQDPPTDGSFFPQTCGTRQSFLSASPCG